MDQEDTTRRGAPVDDAVVDGGTPWPTTGTAPGAEPDLPGKDGRPELLEARDLITYFRTPAGVVRAVDGVSLTLRKGELLGVVGESGSGKTILSRSMMNLLPKRNVVRSGQVLLDGDDLLTYDERRMRTVWARRMAAVFQDPMVSLNPLMKIGQQLAEAPREHFSLSRQQLRDRSIELLRSVRIPEPERRLDQYPHQLSGGMRQRVTIAIALSCDPDILFADEPTTALDVTVQAQILDLLATHQRERNMAILLVTHDLGILAGRADEIVVMYAGQVVERAPTREIFKDTRMPYTGALLESTPQLDNESHAVLATIPGRPPNPLAFPPGCRFAPRCSYAQDRCLTEMPPLVDTGTGHLYRCWYPLGTSAGDEALEANLRRGQSAAGIPVTLEGTGGD
ncbi:MAG: ABC transporter ATP-binding protein [Plantibacter flavus]